MSEGCAAKQRLDKWLFFARIVKSRSLAARLLTDGKVRLNRIKVDKAATMVKIGDELTISLDRRIIIYRVLALGERRGPAVEAQLLYQNLTPDDNLTAFEPAAISQGRRPTKRDRRQLDQWRNHEN